MNLVLLAIVVATLAMMVDAQWGGYGYNSYSGYGYPYGGYQYGGYNNAGGYNNGGGYYNGGGGGYGSRVNQQASVLGVSERVGLGLGR